MFYIASIPDTYSREYPQIIQAPALFIVTSAVTGVGKTTVRERILEINPEFRIMRVFTTRKLRDQRELRYNQFGSREQFLKHALDSDIFCYCKWRANQHIYALLKTEISQFSRNDIVLCAFDCFGSALKSQNPDRIINIWLTCENKQTLKKRLIYRNAETPGEVERRYKVAVQGQDFIVNNKQSLLAKGKIDHFIDTSYISPDQIAQEIMVSLSHSVLK